MASIARRTATAAAMTALAMIAAGGRGAQAHKAVTSKYSYNQDVFPILRDRCGLCHMAGGATPMSLLSYKEAWPWAESIRQELMTAKMPPWYVDPIGPSMTGEHSISARELDVILTWATGGTPEGDVDKKPAPASSAARWTAGEPDLKLEMERDYTVAADALEETREFSLQAPAGAPLWVKGADLLPGTPAMVRDALITVEQGPTLAVWVPGGDAVAPNGTAFKLPGGATIRLRIHYKKPWQQERVAMSDRSTVGLYFATPPLSGHGIETSPLEWPSGKVVRAGRVLALTPSFDQLYASVDVKAVTPNGTTIPLLRLRAPRPEWARRYWLASPVDLPAGSTIGIVTTASPSTIEISDGRQPERRSRPQLLFDYVPDE